MSKQFKETYNELTVKILSSLATHSEWGDLSGELVMDIGCGSGDSSTKCIVDVFPNVGKILAIDNSLGCITAALSKNQHQKTEYRVADIAAEDSVEQWKEKISKILSFRCLSFIPNQDLALKNMYDLLKPGGHLLLHFMLSSEGYNYTLEMLEKPRWKPFLQHLRFSSVSHAEKLNASHYEELLKSLDFTIIFSKSEEFEYAYKTTDEYLDEVLCSPLVPNIPKELMDDFLNDSFETFRKHTGKNSDGLWCYKYIALTALVKK